MAYWNQEQYRADNFPSEYELPSTLPLRREVFGTVICLLGILGNILAVVVLMQRDMRNPFNKLLVTLSCFDTVLLFESAFGFLLEGSEAEGAYRNGLYIYLVFTG